MIAFEIKSLILHIDGAFLSKALITIHKNVNPLQNFDVFFPL